MMIWGTKRKLDKLGIAADFCPICRQIQPFDVSQVKMVKHIYYLAYGKGNIVGHLAVCQVCGLQSFIDLTRYQNFVKGDFGGLKDLIEKTNPGLKQELAERVNVEKRIWNREELSPEERRYLIGEPFNAIAPMLELRYRDGLQMDKTIGRSCLLTITLPLLVWFFASLFYRSAFGDYLKLVAYGLTGVLVLYTLFVALGSHSRYLEDSIYPMFAKSLAPIQPTLDELAAAVKKYKDLGIITGRKIKPEKILAGIEREKEKSA